MIPSYCLLKWLESVQVPSNSIYCVSAIMKTDWLSTLDPFLFPDCWWLRSSLPPYPLLLPGQRLVSLYISPSLQRSQSWDLLHCCSRPEKQLYAHLVQPEHPMQPKYPVQPEHKVQPDHSLQPEHPVQPEHAVEPEDSAKPELKMQELQSLEEMVAQTAEQFQWSEESAMSSVHPEYPVGPMYPESKLLSVSLA